MIGLAYQYFANKSTLLLGGRILFAKVVFEFPEIQLMCDLQTDGHTTDRPMDGRTLL